MMSDGTIDMVCLIEVCQKVWCVCEILVFKVFAECKKAGAEDANKTQNVLAMNHSPRLA